MPVSTSPIATYRTVEISTVPSRPIGTVRCGLRDSPAAVETASKPTYAKNTTPAPRITPEAPKSPKSPSLAGTNGVQLELSTANAPTATNSSSTTILSATIALFTPADWRVPTTSSAV